MAQKITPILVILAILAALIVLLAIVARPWEPDSPISPLPPDPGTPTPIPNTQYPTPTPWTVSGDTSIVWSDPALEQGYAILEYEPGEHVPDWQLYIDVELRQNGETIARQTVYTRKGPATETSTGTFAAPTWEWQINHVGLAEEWLRVRWSAPNQASIIGYHASPDGQLGQRDDRGYTLIGEIRGWGSKIYFPYLSRGGEK